MKFKRTLSFILASLLCGGTLISCTDNNEGGTDTSNDSSSESVADTIDTAGTEDTEEPYVYAPVPENNALTIYVDSAAAEGGDGSESAPLQNIAQAQVKIREIKSTEGLPAGGITVLFASGSHDIGDGIVFTEEDSGTEDCPITYASAEEHGAVFSGGTTLNPADFEPLGDDEKAKLIDESARDVVLKIDLTKYGFTEAQWGSSGTNINCFINEEKATLARYPNKADGADTWNYTSNPSYTGEPDPNRKGVEGFTVAANTFVVDETTLERFRLYSDLSNIFAQGYFAYDWYYEIHKMASFDLETGNLVLASVPYYGISSKEKGARYFIYNVLDEIDTVGEYYVDCSTGTLYLYPSENFDSTKITITSNTDTMISGDVSHLTLKGFAVSESKGKGIDLSGHDFTIDGLKMYNLEDTAIHVNGTNITVQNCEIFHIDRTVILVEGGDIETLTPSGNLVYNNYIHHWAYNFTYQPAIDLEGCGSVASHNEMHDTSHMALGSNGPLHIFEYNEVYRACLTTFDCGAYYSGRRFDGYGTTLRHNYFHEIGSEGSESHAIYWDDGLSGQTAYGNIIANVYGGYPFHVSCGRDNVIENNLIINWDKERSPILYGDWIRQNMEPGGDPGWKNQNHVMAERLAECQSYNAWLETFEDYGKIVPFLRDYEGDHGDPWLSTNPGNATIRMNMCYLTRYANNTFEISDAARKMSNVIELNLIMWDEEHTQLPNFESEGDPTLSEDSYAYKAGFEPIPFDQIGRVH